MSRSRSRAAASATALAAVSVTAALTGPPASAEMTGVSVTAGSEGIVTGCRYTITATVTDLSDDPASVFFWLSGGVIPGNGERLPGTPIHHPANNTVTTTWTPTRPAPKTSPPSKATPANTPRQNSPPSMSPAPASTPAAPASKRVSAQLPAKQHERPRLGNWAGRL
ncbi:hypothetical protein ACFYO1_43185 [Nocardia sp. NPDC006044]|uniref:hypothetical protein n=1 Tax=Nocardia sp. NPDC006044 TaxID=3364306 RepID=UPI0036C9231F